jgi:predicted ATPase
MPLAIEMAASRIPVLAPGQIAELLEDRLESLAISHRDVATRHQTLRDVFEWSYELLDVPQQILLGELAVFAGEFELGGIRAIAEPSLQKTELIDAMKGLVDASLLKAHSQASRAVRYRMLQTVREFALERLEAAGRRNEVFERHADYFLDRLDEAGASSADPAFSNWMETIEETYSDVQQALDWSLANQPRSKTLRGAQALREYWHRSGKAAEAARWAPRLLEGSESAPSAFRADAYNCLSFAHTLAGNSEDAIVAGREAARLSTEAEDQGRLVTSLSYTAHAALSLGDAETMFGAAGRALEVCEETSDRWRRVQPLTVLAFAEFFGTRNLEKARGLFEEALPIYRELGDLGSMVLMTLGPLCTLCLRMGDVDAAEEYGLEAVAAVGGGWQASALACLGEVYVATGDPDKAEALERRAIAMALESGIELWFRISARNLALIAMHRGEFAPAARLHGASLQNMPQFGMDPAVYEPIESSVRQALGAHAFERLSEEGRRLGHQEILDIALGGKGRDGA